MLFYSKQINIPDFYFKVPAVSNGMIYSTRIFFVLFFIAGSFFIPDASGQQKFVFEKPAMGSPFTISIYANDSAKATQAASLAFHCADSLNEIFSDYIDSSELNRLNANSGQNRFVPVSEALFDILKYSIEAARLSNGAYDISMGPVVKLWRKARKEKRLPNPDSLKVAMQKVGHLFIHLNDKERAVWLEKKGMLLDLGGLGKGYVAQAALSVIQSKGFRSAMVNAGGKIAIGEAPPGRQGWRIGITIPEEKEALLPRLLLLKNTSVATSGDIYQHLDINGKRYSHIINPKTGIGMTRQRNVTVIAKDATISDWLATACSVLSEKKSFSLIKKIPGAALLISEVQNGKLIRKSTPNFESYFEN
jgi:thiamine biosynthesis lipoprotein